jgi:phenylacetate-CoA ligase
VATAWDRYTPDSLAAMQDELVREQISSRISPYSPLWRRRFNELGYEPARIRTVADVAELPAMGERDVSPNGDPNAMSALVLQDSDADVRMHPPRPGIGAALRLGRANRDARERHTDADIRATSYLFAGLGFRYPLASTARDLDALSRAGTRLWAVLGLTRDDILVSAVPLGASIEHVGLEYAARAADAPALFPGAHPPALAATVRLAQPTVIAVPSGRAVEILSGLSDLGSVSTLLLLGAPTDSERVAASHALSRGGAPSDACVLAVHAPSGARVLWGECRPSGGKTGLHTYPDLDLVQLVDPDTGENAAGAGEIVLTQLVMTGSALLRWRTGDVAGRVVGGACPACGRTVARVERVRREALVARLQRGRTLDLRAVAAVLSGRRDLDDWRLVVGPRRRDGAIAAVVHYATGVFDDPEVVIEVASDIRGAAGTLPTQLVAAQRDDLSALPGERISRHMVLG